MPTEFVFGSVGRNIQRRLRRSRLLQGRHVLARAVRHVQRVPRAQQQPRDAEHGASGHRLPVRRRVPLRGRRERGADVCGLCGWHVCRGGRGHCVHSVRKWHERGRDRRDRLSAVRGRVAHTGPRRERVPARPRARECRAGSAKHPPTHKGGKHHRSHNRGKGGRHVARHRRRDCTWSRGGYCAVCQTCIQDSRAAVGTCQFCPCALCSHAARTRVPLHSRTCLTERA